MKTLIKNSVFQNIKQKHNTGKTIGCFTETIGCLYQFLIDKAEFKKIGIEKLYTVVYTGSLQIQSYIQSSQKPWWYPLSNHHLITYTTTKRMTLNTSRNTLSLANTKILDLEHLKNTQPISANTKTKLFNRVQGLHLLQKTIWNQYKQNHIPALWSITRNLAISTLWKTLLEKLCQRFLILKSVFLNIFKDVVCYQILTNS